jgi:hypothetical protein
MDDSHSSLTTLGVFVGAVGVLISDRHDDDDGDGNVKDLVDRNDIANVAMKNVKADAIMVASVADPTKTLRLVITQSLIVI